MPIEIEEPLVRPPEPEKVYSEIWIPKVVIETLGPNGELTGIHAEFKLAYRNAESGVAEYHPTFSASLDEPDLYAEAAQDPDLAAALAAAVTALTNFAKRRGLFGTS